MWRGIRTVRPGTRLGDIGHAIQTHVEAHGFSVVREYCGHGIGRIYHEDPQVLHYGRPGTLDELVAGMTFTIEPMVNAGKAATRVLPDGWTVVTRDHSLSAQWEHTILVTPDRLRGIDARRRGPGRRLRAAVARDGHRHFSHERGDSRRSRGRRRRASADTHWLYLETHRRATRGGRVIPSRHFAQRSSRATRICATGSRATNPSSSWCAIARGSSTSLLIAAWTHDASPATAISR